MPEAIRRRQPAHHFPLDGGPLVGQRYRNGRRDVTVRVPGGASPSSDTKRYRLPAIAFGKWNDTVCHVRFSRGKSGLVKMWMNGKRVLTHKGPLCFPGGEDLVYHKFGLYPDRWKEPMTIYFDNYTAGESSDASTRRGSTARGGLKPRWHGRESPVSFPTER